MKKKLLGIAIIAIVAIGATWNVNANKNKFTITDLALSNVEALAGGEWTSECPNGCTASSGTCQCRGTHPYREARW